MTDRDLELFATEELIDELLRRTTLQGVIVHTREEARRQDWAGERMFSVRFNDNFETREAGRLLEVVSRHLADPV
jgi:hypothetical protein